MRHSLYLTILFFTLYSSISNAQTTLAVEPTHHYFNYTEFDINDNQLNKERGWMPGLQVELSTSITESLSTSFSFTELENDVAYIGLTNKGRAMTTRTDEKITSLGAQLQLRLVKNNRSQIHTFITLQQKEWQRDIRPNGPIAGLYEVYEWLETGIGVRLYEEISPSLSWAIEISKLSNGLFDQHSPTIYVDLSQIKGGTTTLDIGTDDDGSRLAAEINYRILPQLNLGLHGYVESWDFGRSNTAISQGGEKEFAVTEPRSQTRNHGVKLFAAYQF